MYFSTRSCEKFSNSVFIRKQNGLPLHIDRRYNSSASDIGVHFPGCQSVSAPITSKHGANQQCRFGVLLAITMITALLADLFLLPALVMVLRPFGPEQEAVEHVAGTQAPNFIT